MRDIVPSIREVYEQIQLSKGRYGKFRKCELHLHTPESYDYELIAHKQYKDLSIEDIYEACIKNEYLNEETIEVLRNQQSEFTSPEYLKEIEKIPVTDFKEYLSYMLIAHRLYQEKIEVAIVCDHNTTKGYIKMKFAVEEYYKTKIKHDKKSKQECISILLGIEISCSDRQHLITILPDNQLDSVQTYLEEILLSEVDGSYIDSRTLIEGFSKDYNAICYLAHLNSSNYLGSGAYNCMLFSSACLYLLGTKNIDQIKCITDRISSFGQIDIKRLQFVLEGDAHNIEDIGIRNTWVKFEKTNFNSLKKAVQNRNICIRLSEPKENNRYIKGMAVIPGKEGFLLDTNNTLYNRGLFTSFSEDLNCIIGGRGTGKSTLLNMLEIMLTRECSSLEELEFISNHASVYCVFYLEGTEYILHFIPQVVGADKHYYISKNDKFYGITQGEKKIRLSDNWTKLYKLQNREFILIDNRSSKDLLDKIFRRNYNINELVSKINLGEIADFIREVVTYGMYYNSIESYNAILKQENNRSFNKKLREILPAIIVFISKKNKDVNKCISSFNQQNKNLIEVVYSPQAEDPSYLSSMLDKFKGNHSIAKTYLTQQQCQEFIIDTIKKIGYLEFLRLLMNKQYKKIETINSIKNYEDFTEISFHKVEAGLQHVTEANITAIYNHMKSVIEDDRQILEKTIIQCFKITDEFTLKFNVNSKESIRTESCNMKDIKELSLGQKVVAILTFVFNFGLYCNDNTPLIIDQPEDNLDNQYIYKNLVNSLRNIKANRQVIIVTHSSTIVTNADAEQVIVMASNNKNGWVEKRGYPSDPTIIKHILNYLEGGEESFKHKNNLYKLFIPSLTQ